MKIVNSTATALLVVLVFYLLIVGKALLLPLIIAIALWYLINTLASAFAGISIAGFHIPKAGIHSFQKEYMRLLGRIFLMKILHPQISARAHLQS